MKSGNFIWVRRNSICRARTRWISGKLRGASIASRRSLISLLTSCRYRSDDCSASGATTPPATAPASHSRRDHMGASLQLGIWNSEFGIRSGFSTRIPNSKFQISSVPFGGARQKQTQDEGRKAEQGGADKVQGVAVQQGASGCQSLDHQAGEALREFADVGVGGAKKGVLGGRVAEAGQA